MMKDRLFQRLAHLIKQRFDKNITFTDFSARLRVADTRSVTAVQRNPHAPLIVMGSDVVFPIHANDTTYGFITLFDGTSLEPEQLDQIREITNLMFTETCVLEERAQRLKVLEHHLKNFDSFEEVVDLRSRMNRTDKDYIHPEVSINTDSLDKVFPILVESHANEEAREFAVEMHRQSDRSMFVTFEPYLTTEVSTLESLKALGPVTLFIPNLADVPLDIQLVFESFLDAEDRSTLHPRLIAAVLEKPEQLIDTGTVSGSLVEKLSSARVKLPPRGTSSMTIDEIMNFFEPQASEKPQDRHLYLVTPPETH